MKTQTENALTPGQKLLAVALGTLLCGLVVMWYNHILFPTHLKYWQCTVIGAILNFAGYSHKWVKEIFGFILCVALFVQALSWFSIVSTPLFK